MNGPSEIEKEIRYAIGDFVIQIIALRDNLAKAAMRIKELEDKAGKSESEAPQ